MFTRKLRTFTFMAMFCLAAGAAHATADWSWQNPSPQGNWLLDVVVVDAVRYIAVGYSGTIIETLDGGATWTVNAHTAGIGVSINAMSFQPASAIPGALGTAGTNDKSMIVDDDGRIYRDIGGDYELVETSPFRLHAIERDKDGGDKWVAVGDTARVYVSEDCGETWVERSVPGTSTSMLTVSVIGNDIVVGSGAGNIWKSTDCGQSWSAASVPAGAGFADGGPAAASGIGLTSINAIHFLNAMVGKAVGDFGGIAGTTDGGATWTLESPGTTLSLYDVVAIDANTWIVVGNVGFILRTTDGGATWQQVPSGTFQRLDGVDRAGSTVVAVGMQGTILHSADAGTTFQSLSMGGLNKHFYRVLYMDDMRGLAVGETGTILKTTDGGATWAAIASGTNRTLYGLDREPPVSAAQAVAGGGAEVLYTVGLTGKIMRSDDAGDTWVSQTSGTTRKLGSIAVPAAGTAFICGDNGTILATTDGGANWTPQSSGTVANLADIDFVDAVTGFIVGAGGVILKTVNGGTSWIPQTSGTGQNLAGVDFIDANTGTAVGWGGTILKTTNGGQTWTPQAGGGSALLYAVEYLDANTGLIVGSPLTLYTTDGGQTWTPEQTGTGHTLYDVEWSPDGGGGLRATAVGVFSTIISRVFGGTVSADPLPLTARVMLRPNAPNPFVHTTTIGYDLPREASVRLEVFDLGGRRVGRMFEARQPAGRHEVAFDGSRLASGVYYYRLTAGEERHGGRMVVSR